MTAHLEPLRKSLYDEMLSHIQETDETAPLQIDGIHFDIAYVC